MSSKFFLLPEAPLSFSYIDFSIKFIKSAVELTKSGFAWQSDNLCWSLRNSQTLTQFQWLFKAILLFFQR